MNRVKALIYVLAIALAGTLGSDFIYCQITYCPMDDGAIGAEALIGPALVVMYMIYTLVFVFVPSIHISKYMGIVNSAVFVSLVSAALFSWLMYVPKIDTAIRVGGLFLWLFLPWFFAVYVGNRLWPHKSA